jgi:hypothetical protein
MLVSGTIGNSSALRQDIQETVASPAQKTSFVSDNTTSGAEDRTSDSSSKQNQKKHINAGVEKAVREYFADIPLMVEVSKCESHYRQFNADGSVFRGKINTNDVGALQINETYHLKRATELGYDIHSLEGNMAYARLLYKEQGPQPWASSFPCWGKSPLAGNFKPKVRASARVIQPAEISVAMPSTPDPVLVAEATTQESVEESASLLSVPPTESISITE